MSETVRFDDKVVIVTGAGGAFKQVLVDTGAGEQIATAASAGRVLRYVGAIEDGRCTVKLQAVPTAHALASVRDGQNALAFTTRYYNPHPLVLRGYGAGPDVTAAGLFADVLRCLAWRRDD